MSPLQSKEALDGYVFHLNESCLVDAREEIVDSKLPWAYREILDKDVNIAREYRPA